MNYNKHIYNLMLSKLLNHNMIKLKNKIKSNYRNRILFKKKNIFFVFFSLRAEIKNLQNEIERNKPLLDHYKRQVDLLEQRTPIIHGKILN